MNDNKFQIKRSAKTNILNYFRRALTIPAIESAIAERSSKNPTTLWKKIVPPDYLYPKGSIRKVEREGIKFTLDISNCVQHGLYYFGMGESIFDIVESEIKNSRVIFDIGAHLGTASIIASRMNNSAMIYAFEPHPVSFKTATEILKNNEYKNISLFNFGLGDKAAKLKLYEVNEHNAGMNRVLKGEQDFPYAEVEISTIDNFVSENNIQTIDFIKIDVEGFEFAVIKGGDQSLRKFKPVLFIELDDNNLRDNGNSAEELISMLFSYGYKSITRTDTRESLTEKSNFMNCHFDILVK